MTRSFVIYLIRVCTDGGKAPQDEYLDNLNFAAADITKLRGKLAERGISLHEVVIISPQLMFSDLYGVVPHAVVMDWREQMLSCVDLAFYPPDSGTSEGVMMELACCAEEIEGRPFVTVVRDFELAVNLASDWLNTNCK